MRHDHLKRRIFEDEMDPLLRIGGIQRHVCRTRLEDGQQRHHHFHRPLHADAYQLFGTGAQRAQMAGKPVRPGVQFPVS